MTLDPTLLSGFAGILLSLVLSYVPGLNVKFAALSSEIKSLIVLISLFVVSLFVGLSSCFNLWVLIPCDKPGIMKLVEFFIVALIASQSLYQVSPMTQAVKDAKLNR